MEELTPSEPGPRDLTSLPTTTTKDSTTTMQCLDHIELVTTLFKSDGTIEDIETCRTMEENASHFNPTTTPTIDTSIPTAALTEPVNHGSSLKLERDPPDNHLLMEEDSSSDQECQEEKLLR
jgi:hypothetical protein